MSFKTTLLGAALAVAVTAPAFAQGIEIEDAYARSSGMSAMAGAAFMIIRNTGDTDDRLIAATAPDVAQRTELHTHIEDDNGVMRMVEVEQGFALPAGGEALLRRGGNHVMFMGLIDPFEQGETLSVTLTFERAGEMVVEIPVDLERQDMTMQGMQHGDMKGNQMGQDDN